MCIQRRSSLRQSINHYPFFDSQTLCFIQVEFTFTNAAKVREYNVCGACTVHTHVYCKRNFRFTPVPFSTLSEQQGIVIFVFVKLSHFASLSKPYKGWGYDSILGAPRKGLMRIGLGLKCMFKAQFFKAISQKKMRPITFIVWVLWRVEKYFFVLKKSQSVTHCSTCIFQGLQIFFSQTGLFFPHVQNFTVIVSKIRVLGQKTTGGGAPNAPQVCLGFIRHKSLFSYFELLFKVKNK